MALELEHLRKQEVRSWPHAIGVIDEARVETRRFEYQGRHLTYDEIGIAYRFTVAGVEHHGSRFRGNSNWLGASEVDDVREKYRAGEKCVVYYDPTDPEDCVLQFYRSQQHDESVPVLAVGFMIGGLVGVGFVVRDFVRLLARASAIPDENQVA